MSKRKYMRNPNGFGSVYPLSGNRRRPYAASKTVSYGYNKEKKKFLAKRKIIGYYKDRSEAMAALIEYNKNPYDLEKSSMTFAELFALWSEDHFSKHVSDSYRRTIDSAFQHAKPLHNMKMNEIKVAHLEQAIRKADVGNPTKQRMKSLFNMLYRYALRHEIVEKDYAHLCDPVQAEPPKQKRPFSREEINRLWDHLEIPYVDMILIEIYMGWRPQELCLLRTENVDLEAGLIYGGMKTVAGKDRVVPIHRRIMPLLQKRALKKGETQFFRDPKGEDMTYQKYRHGFKSAMDVLGMQHTPHETRHTFISILDSAGANSVCIKLLAGHTLRDITEKVYTHKDLSELRAAIDLME